MSLSYQWFKFTRESIKNLFFIFWQYLKLCKLDTWNIDAEKYVPKILLTQNGAGPLDVSWGRGGWISLYLLYHQKSLWKTKKDTWKTGGLNQPPRLIRVTENWALIVLGELIEPTLFQITISSWNSRAGGPKFLFLNYPFIKETS